VALGVPLEQEQKRKTLIVKENSGKKFNAILPNKQKQQRTEKKTT
jgi:hypothetical protein